MTRSNENEAVSKFIDQLEEPPKALVATLRRAILESNSEITEQIKWNAPSFCFAGDDRLTFRLKTKDGDTQLIFHRGAKVKDSNGFTFDDSSGLLVWVAADRAIVTLTDLDDAQAKSAALVKVANDWMIATT